MKEYNFKFNDEELSKLADCLTKSCERYDIVQSVINHINKQIKAQLEQNNE